MKKSAIFSLSLLLIVACLFASCNTENANTPIFGNQDSSGSHTNNAYDATLRELENKLITLQQNQYISDAEYQKELQKLQKRIEELKALTNQTTETDTKTDTNSGTSEAKFLYILRDGKAEITGYTGKDENLVIPGQIDGHEISGIAGNAFSYPTLKTVIISNGITSIDWFAFDGCTALEAVTIPASVNSIGHSAFNRVNDRFTIYCTGGSFAQSYAISYGLRYTII